MSAPFTDIETAFFSISFDGIIRLFDGVYTGPSNQGLFMGTTGVTIESINGAANCVIDLGGTGNLLTSGNFGPTAPSALRGLTIRNGASRVIRAEGRIFDIEDCRFVDNDGGALWIVPGSTVRRSNFTANSASGNSDGGAILATPPITISDCVFDFNTAFDGGAISVLDGDCDARVAITHCVFRGNEAIEEGGAITMRGCSSSNGDMLTIIDNCFGSGNKAGFAGGFLHLRGFFGAVQTTRVSSCTLALNEVLNTSPSFGGGGAIWMGNSRRVEVQNSILAQNTALLGPEIRVSDSAAPSELVVDHSTVQGGPANIRLGSGTFEFLPSSLDVDPGFMSVPTDYRLAPGSPCIDAGSVALLPIDFGDINSNGAIGEEVPDDLLRASRRRDDPNAPDVGSGASPLPDMGAFER